MQAYNPYGYYDPASVPFIPYSNMAAGTRDTATTLENALDTKIYKQGQSTLNYAKWNFYLNGFVSGIREQI